MKQFLLLIACSLLLLDPGALRAQNTCATAQAIPALPFTSTGQTTAGTGDDYDDTMSCLSLWMTGDDYVYSYNNLSGATQITITLSNTSTYTSVFVLNGCPDAAGVCMGSSTSTTTPPPAPLCVTLPTNGVYYIIVSSFGFVNQTVNFDINITGAPGTLGSDCANAFPIPALPYASTGNTTNCYGDNYDNTSACGGNYLNGNDFVYTYTTAITECVSASLANTVTCAGLFLVDGCPDLGGTTCLASATGQDPSFGGVTIGPGTYYFVVSSNPLCANDQVTPFDINITTAVAGLPGSTCGNPQTIASLPYNNTGLTTCCYGNDYNSTDACASAYMNGDDYVFAYTSAGNECLSIQLSNVSVGASVGVFLLDGCPDAVGTNCIGQATQAGGAPALGTTIAAAGTYYIVVSSTTALSCTSFDIDITSVPAGATGSQCANAVSIPGFPFTANGETTACMANDYTNASAGSCGTAFETGEDKVYEYVKLSSASECVTLTLSNCTSTGAGFTVYDGCPDLGTTNCIASGGGPVAGTLTGTVILPGSGTYYFIIDSNTDPNFGYDLSITSNGPGQPNDLPCNAVALTLGNITFGDNTCSSNMSEPAAPACWSGGSINTVWYSVVCPASGEISVRTFAGTLTNTQIGLYSGPCASLTNVACNDNFTFCSNNLLTSEIVATGLTPGNTYYIAIDGNLDSQGIFSVVAVDGTTNFPVVPGQDCSVFQSITACNSVMTVGNPGFSGTGNVCDFSGTGNCTTGELNSAWYLIDIAANGNLAFSVIPNDATPTSCGAETDYDFVLWKITGAGATTCAAIQSSGGGSAAGCNYSFLGVTGLNGTGVAPAPYSNCFDAAFGPQVPVVAGEQFVLCVQNFSGNSSGFSLDFSQTPLGVINFSPPSSVTWGGTNSTSWTDVGNWGNCVAPACAIDAIIVAGPTNMPVITGTQNVNNVTINAGATLTLAAGATLNVCGDFVNLGNLVADPTSTIVFNNGSATQNLSGNLVGGNALGNLTITKTGGMVNQNANVEVAGTFTTSNGSSIFNTNGRYVIVGGNFINSNSSTTFANVGTTGTLEFNGTGLQQFGTGGILPLNNVIMNNTGAGVNLASDHMEIGTSGSLTLLQGVIITNALRVQVLSTNPGSVGPGNATSYVQGNLRRFLNPTGSYDFPVGHATQGYQRANIDFTGATTIPYLDARFDPYVIVPGPLGGSECGFTYDTPALNHGNWTITAGANPNSGTYNCTLYNTNYTNAAAFWTVKRSNGTWALVNGTCDLSSTAAVTRRNGMSGFSLFGVAQSSTIFPIELTLFDGTHMGSYNLIEWETASEHNNAFFVLERSPDGTHFAPVVQLPGAGNTTETQSYSHEDHNLTQPVYFYRLKQVDADGSFEYSNTILLRGSGDGIGFSALYPNPAQSAINLDLVAAIETDLELQITDVQGKILRSWTATVGSGNATVETSVEDLAAGLYFLRVSAPALLTTEVFKFVVEDPGR